jgi:hypothetical protein
MANHGALFISEIGGAGRKEARRSPMRSWKRTAPVFEQANSPLLEITTQQPAVCSD